MPRPGWLAKTYGLDEVRTQRRNTALMYREDDGSLAIADFKTDISVSEEQLAAY